MPNVVWFDDPSAVQVSAAMKRIPDGATISVDGSTGHVRLLE